MSWAAIIGLGLAAFALKAIGPVLVGRRPVPADVTEVLGLIAVPVLAALILVQTFDGAGRLVLDARVRRWPSRRCSSGGGRRSSSSCSARRRPRRCCAPSSERRRGG